MSSIREQVDGLVAKASVLPHGPAQVALLEEAVRLADLAQDIELGYDIRNELMRSACFSGRPDALLVAFAWCVAQYDRDPERFDNYELLWKYKWVISDAIAFPQISRARLEELLADMERRYRASASTMHAVWLLRRKLFAHFSQWREARAAHAEARKCGRDWLSDCAACVACEDCRYFVAQRQWKRAVEAAQPVLQKHLTCAEEPHRTFARVLRPLLALGRQEEAQTYQRQGYRLIRNAQHFVGEQAEHLRFLTQTGDAAQAKRVLERHLPYALASVQLDERFEFFLAARFWSERSIQQDTRRLKVRLPADLPMPDDDGKSDVKALSVWFAEQARELARRFDARNGTDAFQKAIDEAEELVRRSADRA